MSLTRAFAKKIDFLGGQLFKQLEKKLANPKIADIMPRAKNAETAGRRDLFTRQLLSLSFNHFFKIQNYIVHASVSLPVKVATS